MKKVLITLLLAFANLCLVHALSPFSKTSNTQERVKSVVFLGDSNLWSGGDDCTNSRSWSYWFKNILQPETCRSYARSGATWSNTERTKADVNNYSEVLSDENVIWNQVLLLINDIESKKFAPPQYIFIMAGTNDAWFHQQRPSLLKESVHDVFSKPLVETKPMLSLAAAVRYNCELLHTRLPQSKVILVTPMLTIRASKDRVSNISNVIADCGKRLNAPVIRLDTPSLINPLQERKQKQNTIDGTHTNVRGAEKIGRYIVSQFKFILIKK